MNILKRRVLGVLKKFKFLPPPIYMKIYYKYYTGNTLNLEDPVDFNEKIQWLKVYYHPEILHQLVDKYEVRKYVEEKIGKEYLNELYGVYKKPRKIDFDSLPKEFVLKATHGYNSNLIVRDKGNLNVFKTRLTLMKWMNKNHYYLGGLEWAYKDVPPRIIAEKYIPEIDNKGLSDIKLFCFNGKPEFAEVMVKINNKVFRAHYDISWNKLEFRRKNIPFMEKEIPKPKNLKKMVEIAEKLADKFPFIRIDLYNIEGKILFGELTFYPADGRWPYTPEKYNKIVGNMMILPKIPEGQKEIKEV